MHSRQRSKIHDFRCLVVAALGQFACRNDYAGESDAEQSEPQITEDGSATDGGTTDGVQRALLVEAPVELCARSPQRQAFGEAPLFYFRSVTNLPAGTFTLPTEDGIDLEGVLPFSIHGSADAEEEEIALPGKLRVDLNMVPSAIYSLVDAEGWQTASYSATGSSGSVPYGFLLQVAYPTGASGFDISDVEALDAERRLDVVSLARDYGDSSSFRSAQMAPCRINDPIVDRVDVTLAEGSVSFHTRPAFWKAFSGFTVLAEGDVAGISFEVDRYWDLEYATTDMGSDLYAADPALAVRFPEQDDGACILVVEPDVHDATYAYVAKILDCEQHELLPLTVESIEFVPGGGEHRW